MGLKKSDAYLAIQKQFKHVGLNPLCFETLNTIYVQGFKTQIREVESAIENFKNIRDAKEYAEKNNDIEKANAKIKKTLDDLYVGFLTNGYFKNHIDVWNAWQKIEDKINRELGIEIEYARPNITSANKPSPQGKKSPAYIKFQKIFISSVGKKPEKYESVPYKYAEKINKEIEKITKMLNSKNLKEKDQVYTKSALAEMDGLYISYIVKSIFRNHIDMWNKFMKLEDKFNEVGINLRYSAPGINS